MGFIRDVFGGGAERDAADAQVAGLDRATEESRRQSEQNRSDFQPPKAVAPSHE